MNAFAGSYLGLAQAVLVASIMFALPMSMLTALTYPRMRRVLGGMAPAVRAALLLALSALPFASAIAGLLATFTPSLLSWLGVAADHCHLHPDHLHLCLSHPPRPSDSALASSLLFTGAALCVLAIGSWSFHWFKTRRAVAQLLRISTHNNVSGVHIVPTEAPLAFAAGLRSPLLFLSSLLLDKLTPGQLDAVIAHERAHAARHDALRQTLASVLTWLHLPSMRRQLLADLALAAEQSCDEAAYTATGDRLLVAEAIVTVEKLFANQVPLQTFRLFATSHFTGSNVPERVQAMLDAPRAARPLTRIIWIALAASLLAIAAAGGPLHHATESLLGLIFH